MRRALVVLVGLVILAVAVGGVLVVRQRTEPVASAAVKDAAFINAETVGVLSIEGGECFADPAYSSTHKALEVVYTVCEDADNQVYAFFELTDGPWDRARIVREAGAECRSRFERTWPAGDGLAYYPVLPTERTWEYGDHDVMCAVHRPGGTLASSVLPRG